MRMPARPEYSPAHVRTCAGKLFGVPVIVAINRFHTDTEPELALIQKRALEAGAQAAVVANHWGEGGEGARLGSSTERLCPDAQVQSILGGWG